jgi:HK97 family phage major capsid protein
MEQELKDALEAIKNQVTEKTKGLDGLENKTAQLIADAEAKLLASTANELKAVKDEFETRLDAIVGEMKAKATMNEPTPSFVTEFASELKARENELKEVGRGQKLGMKLKAATIETNLTVTGQAVGAGGSVINQNGSVIFPTPLVNFSNLVRTVVGTSDTIRIWRETATANAIARVTMPNAKPEQDFLSPAVDFTASYLAGIFRFHKSMMRNLPWMQQRLPEMLRRNFFKKENSLFFTQLKAAATTYTGTGVGVIALVEAIGALEASDYGVNGVVINPSDWATISVTRDDENGFTLPSTVTFINGQLTVNGVPVYKASFVPANNFIVGDWTYAYKYVTDGLKVEFFEQDADNVETNAITSRVEESNVLVIEQPAAFIWGELDGATPSV